MIFVPAAVRVPVEAIVSITTCERDFLPPDEENPSQAKSGLARRMAALFPSPRFSQEGRQKNLICDCKVGGQKAQETEERMLGTNDGRSRCLGDCGKKPADEGAHCPGPTFCFKPPRF